MSIDETAGARIDYTAWFFSVLTWDAALPFLVAVVPLFLEQLFPNRRGVIEFTAVVLPIGAFLLRMRKGKRQIDANACSTKVRRIQFGFFFFGLLPLLMFEAVITLTAIVPAGLQFKDPVDYIVFGVMGAVYLICMIIAMYPGRTVRFIAMGDDVMKLDE